MPDDAARVNETEPPSSMLTDSQAKLLGFRRHRARRDPFAAASVMTMRPHQAGLESKVHPRRQSDDRSKMRPEKDRDVQDDAVGALQALRARLANVVGERDLLERQLKQMEQHLCLLEQQPALDDLKKKLAHTEDDRDAMRRHLKSKCDALETKAAELSVLAAELAALQHFKANCACNAFKNALSKSVTQCDRLRAELDEKNSEISGLTHGLAKVKQACECESLRNQLRLVKQDLALCDDLTAVLEATQAELSTLKQKIVASEEEKQALKQQLAIAQEQLDGIAREWAVQREGDMTALQGRMRDELHTLVHQSEQLRSSLNDSNDKFEQHRLRLLGSVIARSKRRQLSMSFSQFTMKVREEQQERAEDQRRQHIMSKIVRRLMNASISAAFDRWRSNVHEGQQLKAKARKVVQRMINGCLVATFQAWLEHTTAQARRRALMQRMAAKMLLRELSAAFDRWSENVSEPRRSEGIEEEGLVHDNVHRTSRAYDPTAKEKHEARLYRIREAAQPDLLEMANDGIFATFASWHQIVQDLTHALSCTEAPLLNASGPEAKKMAQKMLLRSDQIKSVKVMTDDKTANLNEAGDENAPIVIDVGKQHAHSSFVPTDVRAGAVRNDALTEKEDVKVAEGGVLDPDQTEILLQQLFSYYCDDSSGVRILRMSQKNYLHMVEDCSLFDDFISEDVIISTFALVVRTSQGEETGYLEYPDYIEALARLALIKYNDNGTPIQLFTRLINSELLHAAPAAVKEKVFAGAVPYTHRNESHPFPEFDQDLLDKI